MRTMFLAAATVAALSCSTTATYTSEAKTTAPATTAQTASSQAPAGLPAYLMRPDGLMINGLLPNQGWQD